MPKTCDISRIDSRSAAYHEKLQAGETREVWLTLPSDAQFAVLNVVILPDIKADPMNLAPSMNKKGWCSVNGDPSNQMSPGTTVNWAAGANIGQSQMTTKVTDAKKIWLHSNHAAHFVIDVTGIYW